MARSPKDDPMYDIQHNTWNYRTENGDTCAPGPLNERNQPLTGNPSVLNDNIYVNTNSYSGDVYMNKHPYHIQTNDSTANKDENLPFNSKPNVARINCQNYGNAMLNLGNGQLVRVFYDENNQRLIFPMTGQYELFNQNQGLCDIPLQSPQTPHMFTLNQEYSINNNNVHMQPPITPIPNNTFNQDNLTTQSANAPTSNFIKEVLGNWEPNSSGTYSPFGQNYPLNHPDTPILNIQSNSSLNETPVSPPVKSETSPKRNEYSPLADTGTKKRIVAEVKPMRPTYSDVLSKNTKNNSQSEIPRTVKPQSIETKPPNKTNSKSEKPIINTKIINDESKNKNKINTNPISSGSESGDFNTDDMDKNQKPNKKVKNKRNNMSRKWSSLDDITSEENANFNDNNKSQFVFIENQSEKQVKKEKKVNDNKNKNSNKNSVAEDSFSQVEEEESSQFIFQEGQTETIKSKKKKERSYHKVVKQVQDKKKCNQSRRRNKPGYLGLAQNYLERWFEATWKAIIWFIYLLSDICHMSAHLSFDLCTSLFTQAYVSSQVVWRSTKDWLAKLKKSKFFLYIDKKYGDTRFAFWKKLKWFKKDEYTRGVSDATKSNLNIPLPATGEEAMERLLACKGKDPYSILGVSMSCTDEEIKRYYRRQAFLVHPDKNQEPGAEEAFKILQHAFNLIGEPERRVAYEQRMLESQHAEAAWSELNELLSQLHEKMASAANTIKCTNCKRRHKRELTDRPCYAARYCAQCKIRHSAKEGDIWAESSFFGLLVMYYACMDGAVYQITQWASCQKKNLRQMRPDCHVVQYRIVLGNKAAAAADLNQRPSVSNDPNLEEFLNNLYIKSGVGPHTPHTPHAPHAPVRPPGERAPDPGDARKRRNKKPKH